MAAYWRYVPPNVVTCISISVGLLSVSAAIGGDHRSAAWFIVLCVLLDKLDGGVARLLKASSRFGLEMDSLADLITFGVAPAVLVLSLLAGKGDTASGSHLFRVLVYACTFFYVIAGALRLAKFNVVTESYGKDFFFGLPTTASGALVAVYYLTIVKYGLPQPFFQALPLLMAVLALAMVSRLPLPKFAKRHNVALNIFQWINIGGIYICGAARILPEYILAAGMLYLIGGMGWAVVHRIRPPSLDQEQSTVDP